MGEKLDIGTIHNELAKKEFIVFAGTGIVDGTGVPSSWESFMERLGKEAGVSIEGRSEEEYPDLAQDIWNKFKEEKRVDLFDEIIKEACEPTQARYSAPAQEIARTASWIVTTNFDFILSRAFESIAEIKGIVCKTQVISLPRFPKANMFDKEVVVHLHGRAHTNYVLLRREQYDKYYPSVSGDTNGLRCLEEYLEFLYSKHTIVFIGFSFLDRYVRTCLVKTRDRLEWQDGDAARQIGYEGIVPHIQTHYAFIKRPCEKDFKHNENFKKRVQDYVRIEEELSSIGIRIVWYDNHVDWQECFKRIRDLRRPGQEWAADSTT